MENAMLNTRLKAAKELLESFLRDNYLTKTDNELGAELGVTGSAVRRRLKKLGLRRRNFKVAQDVIEGEEWQPVPSFPMYDASTLGRIRNREQRHLLQTWQDRYGYVQVRLSVDGQKKQVSVHRVVAEAFLGPANGMTVNHRDGDKLYNAVANLEYMTSAENIEHASISGFLRGPAERISEAKAREICELLHAGRRTGEIASQLDVTLEVVKKIRRRKTWTQVSAPYAW